MCLIMHAYIYMYMYIYIYKGCVQVCQSGIEWVDTSQPGSEEKQRKVDINNSPTNI